MSKIKLKQILTAAEARYSQEQVLHMVSVNKQATVLEHNRAKLNLGTHSKTALDSYHNFAKHFHINNTNAGFKHSNEELSGFNTDNAESKDETFFESINLDELVNISKLQATTCKALMKVHLDSLLYEAEKSYLDTIKYDYHSFFSSYVCECIESEKPDNFELEASSTAEIAENIYKNAVNEVEEQVNSNKLGHIFKQSFVASLISQFPNQGIIPSDFACSDENTSHGLVKQILSIPALRLIFAAMCLGGLIALAVGTCGITGVIGGLTLVSALTIAFLGIMALTVGSSLSTAGFFAAKLQQRSSTDVYIRNRPLAETSDHNL